MFDYVLAITAMLNGTVVEYTSPESSREDCEESFVRMLAGPEAQGTDLLVHACVPIDDARAIGIWR